jgi:hypothetical protein
VKVPPRQRSSLQPGRYPSGGGGNVDAETWETGGAKVSLLIDYGRLGLMSLDSLVKSHFLASESILPPYWKRLEQGVQAGHEPSRGARVAVEAGEGTRRLELRDSGLIPPQ